MERLTRLFVSLLAEDDEGARAATSDDEEVLEARELEEGFCDDDADLFETRG